MAVWSPRTIGQVARFPESRAQIGIEIVPGQVGFAGHALLQRCSITRAPTRMLTSRSSRTGG
jgi:hypothetical protein